MSIERLQSSIQLSNESRNLISHANKEVRTKVVSALMEGILKPDASEIVKKIDELAAAAGENKNRPHLEYLEPHSELLYQTFEMAQRYMWREIDYDAIQDFFGEQYNEHDSESYDCHSFALSLLKRELGLPVMTAPEFQIPDRKKFEYETYWLSALSGVIKGMFNSPAGQEYKERLKQFTENIHENSVQIPIPKIRVRGEASVDRCEAVSQDITRRVLEIFNGGGKSSLILISDGRGDEFYDAHSILVLGVEAGRQDFLVLEKEQTGSPVHVRRLSKVIQSYSYGYICKAPELNICNRPIGELYPNTA